MIKYLTGLGWFQNTLDFVFPPLCCGCGELTEQSHHVCPNCLVKIEKINHAYCLNCSNLNSESSNCPACLEKSFPLFSYGLYRSPLKDMIIQYKFKGIRHLAELFADLLSDLWLEDLKKMKIDYIIPIPLYSIRENIRGYNQAELLAEHLSRRLNIKTNSKIVFRDKKRKPQARLKTDDRSRNIKNVFKVIEPANNNRSVLLVDDVVTSGSTILELRRVLSEAGYVVKGAVSIAHVE